VDWVHADNYLPAMNVRMNNVGNARKYWIVQIGEWA
jgi:hypothetical protein